MGIWYEDKRMDYFCITDEQVKKNADCVAAIVFKKDLVDEKNGFSTLNVKNFGESFELYNDEPFRDQPVLTGRMSTGFLVEKNIVATAAHIVNATYVRDIRIVFGYKMLDHTTPVIRIPNENIYEGISIVGLIYNPRSRGGDWALVRLDREVKGQEMVVLSNDKITRNQTIYTIGHPAGLPLKYAPGAKVRGFKDSLFSADLDTYMGSSGSPVFNSDTHEVIGIVVHGDPKDFRWTGKGWASIIYPSRDITSQGPQCTKVSEFVPYINNEFVDSVKVFISYSHKDKVFVDRLALDLKSKGMDVWVFEKKIKVGESIIQKVEEGIARCDYFCLVISRHSVNSNWVKREYRTALNKQLSSGTTPTILPILIQDVELPELLKEIKYADFLRDYSSGFNQLLDAIEKH